MSVSRIFFVAFCFVFIHVSTSVPLPILTNKSVIQSAGKSVVLLCSGKDLDSYTTGNWSWELPAQLISACAVSPLKHNRDVNVVFCSPYVKVFQNGSLVIESANLSHTGVYSCSGLQNNTLLKTFYNLTIQDRPSEPFSLSISEFSETHVFINWTSPLMDNGSPVTHYKVVWLKYGGVDGRGRWDSPNNFQDGQVDNIPHILALMTNSSNQILMKNQLYFNVTNLFPYSLYCLAVSALNEFGWSEPRVNCTQRTKQCRPLKEPSVDVKVLNSTCAHIELKVLNREVICGKMQGYKVNYRKAHGRVSEVDKSSKGSWVPTDAGTVDKKSNLLLENIYLSGLLPWTSYEIRCSYFNERFNSPEFYFIFQTLEGLPESPRYVHLPIEKLLTTSIAVNWLEPLRYNGEPRGFSVQYFKKINNSNEYKLIGVVDVHYIKNEPTSYEAVIEKLEPATDYRVRVAARNNKFTGEWSENYTVGTDVSAPAQVTDFKIETDVSIVGIVLMWKPPPTEYPTRLYFSVCWRVNNFEMTCQSGIAISLSKGTINEPGVLAPCSCANSADNCDQRWKVCYLLPWSNLKGSLDDAQNRGKIKSDSSLELRFIVRSRLRSIYQQDLFMESENSVQSNLVISLKRLQDLVNIQIFSTSHEVTKENIIVGVSVAVALLIVIAAVLAYLSYRYLCEHRNYLGRIHNSDVTEQMNFSNIHNANGSTALSNRNGTSGSYARLNPLVLKTYKECSFSHIPMDEFRNYVASGHANSQHKFLEDWEEVNAATKKYPSLVCDYAENRDKNRYTDILCFDHSRVILQSKSSSKNASDYINANFVDGYNMEKAFIAAQGPMPDTFEDFWLMIWENACPVVVMISNLVECGRRKCDQYWPSDGVATYGQIQVRFVRIIERSYYIYRLFSVCRLGGKKWSKERLLHHYHYTEWPDFGVPTHSLQVLQFVRRTIEHKSFESGPMVVHCSAGVGRTGTYICIQAQMEQIAQEQTVNVKGWLTHIRQQRVRLVQSEQQFYFIHDTLAEYILYPDHEVRCDNLLAYVSSLSDFETKFGSLTRLQHEFELCVLDKADPSSQVIARKDMNLRKNRCNIYPNDRSRVKLTTIGGDMIGPQERGDYINASILSGFYGSHEFIVTQHPLQKTVTDLWRMVWDQNSQHLVLFATDINSKACDSNADEDDDDAVFHFCDDAAEKQELLDADDVPQFWPSPGQSKECAFLNVTFRDKEDLLLSCVTKTEFRIGNSRDDYSLLTNLWHYVRFPIDVVEALEMVQFIDFLNSRRSDSSAPLIVIDLLGSNEAAFFCSLIYCLDQLKAEKCVDVYMVVKMYHLQRPGIWNGGGIDKVELLYRTLAAVACESPRVLHSPTKAVPTADFEHGNSCDQSVAHGRLPSENGYATSQACATTPSRHSTLPRHGTRSHEAAPEKAFTFS